MTSNSSVHPEHVVRAGQDIHDLVHARRIHVPIIREAHDVLARHHDYTLLSSVTFSTIYNPLHDDLIKQIHEGNPFRHLSFNPFLVLESRSLESHSHIVANLKFVTNQM